MSEVEIVDGDVRENYTKIIMQKRKFIDLSMKSRAEVGDFDLEKWKQQQIAERERIRNLDSTPEPPKRPPKKPELISKHLSSKSQLFTPKPYGSGITGLKKKLKPAVPPKPVLNTSTKTFLIERRLSEKSLPDHEGSSSETKPTSLPFKPAVFGDVNHNVGDVTRNINDVTHNVGDVTERAQLVRVDSQMSDYSTCEPRPEILQQQDFIKLPSQLSSFVSTNEEDSAATRKDRVDLSPKLDLSDRQRVEELEKAKEEKQSLIQRIKSKLNILREEKDVIKSEIEDNEKIVEEIILRLQGIARIRDLDRIRRHSEEVAAVTSLILCLSCRLAKLEAQIKLLQAADKEENQVQLGQLQEKECKLRGQLEEAKQLQQDSVSRRCNLNAIISGHLDESAGQSFLGYLDEKSRLILEMKEVEDKIKLGEEQVNSLEHL